jgi:alkylation response protein AidB-like acyl-CoA dehydrogenase
LLVAGCDRSPTPRAHTSSTAEGQRRVRKHRKSQGTDYFHIADQLTSEEFDYLRRAREFVDGEGVAGHQRILGTRRVPVAADRVAYEIAVAYCAQRRQFGKPLVNFQIVQDRLVKMLAEICSMQLYCLRLGRLIEEAS